ncbi:MAG: polysaccharide biosynthesis protein [Streptococcaceae bacterium]|jgi:O-antigen/teichoic acid export membrane protein|nr:polysaccharide biosynthesis protein [Streptococcaceae bacterium]
MKKEGDKLENDLSLDKDRLSEQKTQMVKGSIWLVAGNLVSRLLGAVYIIPWYAWMGSHGNEANGLFSMGYNIYALFLLISTAGIPGAVAKQTAKYNALKEYNVSKRLFLTGLKSMAVLGAIFAGVMFLAAPLLAEASGGGPELIPVMRSLAIAVFVFPCMSVIRGFFQGNNLMAPFSISQVVEQLARVLYMLITAYIIMQVRNGNYVDAVVQSTFAAFIGMIASFGVLLYFLLRERKVQQRLELEHGVRNINVNSKELLIETVRQAIPFIIVGSGVQLFKIVDQFTFSNILSHVSNYTQAQLLDLFSIFSSNPDKLTMVIVALAASIAGTGLPLITENYTVGRKRELATLVSNNIQLFFFIMLPSAIGMTILAQELYSVFYVPSPIGESLLAWAAIQSLMLGYYMLTSNMLQGMYQNRITVKYLAFGLITKLIFQFPCVYFFEVYGPMISTFIGFAVSCTLITRLIRRVSFVNFKKIWKRVFLLVLMTVIMGIVTIIMSRLLHLFLSPDKKLTAFIIVLISAISGGGVYMYLALATKIADKLLGNRVVRIRNKLPGLGG